MGYDFNFVDSGYVVSYDFHFRSPYHSILAGTSNNFIAIWADPDASMTNGKFYASTADATSVVNTADSSLYDAYTQTRAGRGNETLNSDDIVDINVAP